MYAALRLTYFQFSSEAEGTQLNCETERDSNGRTGQLTSAKLENIPQTVVSPILHRPPGLCSTMHNEMKTMGTTMPKSPVSNAWGARGALTSAVLPGIPEDCQTTMNEQNTRRADSR